MIRAIPFLMLLLGSLQISCTKSDDEAADKKPKPTAPAITPTTQALSQMAAGDLLAVGVGELTGPGTLTTFPRQIEADGTITLPVIANPIAVAGKTRSEIEGAITKQYRDEHVIQNVMVSVRRLRVAGSGGPMPGPVAPFDLVRIGIAELTGPASMTELVMRVDGDGAVSLPYVGRQKISGLTIQKAEVQISQAYRQNNVIAQPILCVLRLEAAPEANTTALPDLPVNPVPEMLRWLYEPRMIK